MQALICMVSIGLIPKGKVYKLTYKYMKNGKMEKASDSNYFKNENKNG